MPRVFHDPVAEPRCAAGGRSSNIIIISSVRRERPSSIVRPQPESCPFRFGVVSLGPVYGWHPLSPSTSVSSRSAAQAAPAGRCARVGLLTELGVSAPASRARGN